MRFYRVRVVRTMPHPERGFTQGLIVSGGTVWESSGQYGISALRRYPLGAPKAATSVPLRAELFAEGICPVAGDIWQLTWRERVALRWDARTLELTDRVPFNREGWGICAAGDFVMTSDGSSELVRRDRVTLTPLEVVVVHCAGHRITGLNDLAWSGGLVWANVLARPFLAGIDPDSGEVVEVADARRADERHWGDPNAVMNGIAAMPGAGEFLLTGKGWRHSYHVRLMPSRSHRDPVRLLTG